ncbi:MAG: DUF695 domain-containing protein [Mycobacteriales bacterium]
MTATGLLDVLADWVTLRAQGTDGRPVVVLVDRAVATTAPYADHPTQVAVAVPFGPTADGQPGDADTARLRELEQQLVDAAAGHGRLVAVMTLDGVREWVLYARSTDWADPFVQAGISVLVGDDPTWAGLAELTGAPR